MEAKVGIPILIVRRRGGYCAGIPQYGAGAPHMLPDTCHYGASAGCDNHHFAGRCNMGVTYFETYLRALDACADVQGVLGEEWVIHPPNPDYGYESTPRNALTFGCMGVDGVHYAILAIDDGITDESPVIQISPMDFSDLYQAKGDSFLMFLADACGVPRGTMEEVFATERTGNSALAAFLKERFDMSRLWDEKRTQKLESYLKYIQPKA